MPKFATRQINLPGFELGDYIQESIDFLRQNEPDEGYFVGFSGGKDSIVTLELCRIAGVRHRAFYSCTRIDPPEVMRFIKKEYPYVTWLYPEKSFYEYIQKKSPPLRHMRWCCDYLKKKPSSKIPLNHRIMGIRAEESFNRRNRPRIDKYMGKKTLYKPIFLWPEWCIWDFIESQKLPYPALYDMGFSRIGCVVCPFMFGSGKATQAKQERSQAMWPGVWRAFEHAVRRWFECSRTHHKVFDQTADDYWKAYIHGEKIAP